MRYFITTISFLVGISALGQTGTPVVPATSTNPLVVAHKGLFSRSSSFDGIAANINGCDPSALYTSVQYRATYVAGLNGCVTGDNSGNIHETIGVQGFATSQNTAVQSVGGSFYGFAHADGVHTFGINPVIQDKAGLSNVTFIGEEIDVQPYNRTAAYAQGYGIALHLINNTNQGGTYPFSAVAVAANVNGGPIPAHWSNGINVEVGALPNSLYNPVLYVQSQCHSSSGANCASPSLLEAFEEYGENHAREAWNLYTAIAAGGDPSDDKFILGHGSGGSLNGPNRQAHIFEIGNGIQLQLDGATSGSVTLSASATGEALNLGSRNATISSKGALSVASCTGCGVPGTLYNAASAPLPSCGATINGEQAVVSDALSPAYLAPYKGGGQMTAPVICSYNGRTYSWVTH
jgi:hypothetical protein